MLSLSASERVVTMLCLRRVDNLQLARRGPLGDMGGAAPFDF